MRRLFIATLLIAPLVLGGCRKPKVQESAVETPKVMKASTTLATLPEYQPESPSPLSGNLNLIGSDSMDPLVQLWAEDFRSRFPGVDFSITSKGSATAPTAMIEGRSLLGHMSREMNADELGRFQARFGYAPTRIVVAVDAIAIYVNANNPIRQLSLEQLDAIFSITRKAGFTKPLDTWGDLGLEGIWKTRAIQPYGRDENSGTRAFFREHVMKKGNFKPEVKALADQFAVVEAAAVDGAGICYGPVQHSVRMVRSVPIVDFGATEAMSATTDNILGGRYPMTRFLYIYVNKAPNQPMNPLVREFLRSILSRQGQTNVANFGAIPLPADLLTQNLDKLK